MKWLKAAETKVEVKDINLFSLLPPPLTFYSTKIICVFRAESRSVSMFAESALSVQRVVTQLSMDQDHHQDHDEDEVKPVSLSPPSQSALMLRRRALYNSQSSSRLKSCSPLIEVS